MSYDNEWALETMQAVLLCEYYSRFRGRDKDAYQSSPLFAFLYQKVSISLGCLVVLYRNCLFADITKASMRSLDQMLTTFLTGGGMPAYPRAPKPN